ncbi:PLP-dependent aminotransferase family protein [Pseudoflavitalea sp. G-6-1-2]|uniref:MocR-like pyridoxine biosynthesis transcription factor PdxR n=1 Tax=Pseudoflavitalea sp. G-6-1-2 TaxID=2728841 RepID=UPI00146DDD31|nr:PLP-dependent aminotransferase family protein [Pseudoflavitalea sp. G-6-1-2]NML23539.1 PLP-dependent aminotransferase family protein [Pseudoflavitalea sp. G-6-1-2]
MLPFERIILIDKNSKTAVYKQIAVSIINAIRNGTLRPGVHLPGSRELARTLNIHRKTAIAAYEELNAQDWITIVPRKHVSVSERIPLLKPQKWNAAESASPFAGNFKLPFRKTVAQVKAQSETSIPTLIIDDGYPDVRLSPIDELLKTYRTFTSRKYAIKNAHTGTDQGTAMLRTELVRYLSETRGLNMGAENILITHGAQMSIYLSARLLLQTGSNIIVAKPGYPVASKAFEETGANVIEVNIDENGIDTTAIETLCKKKKITAVYVIPHHHYPTTVTLSVERRMKLLELSNKYGFAIIEDDYDYDYHYTSSPYLPLASSNHKGNILYIGSFSKVLDPGLRIGFMVAPANFIEQCTALRALIDTGGDGYMQNALATLIRNGEIKRHLKKAKKIYHQRRDFLDSLLKACLSKYITWSMPSGGMAIWVKLQPGYSVAQLTKIPELRIARVYNKQNAFRFGFASMDEKELEAAVNLLKSTLKQR